MNPTEIFDVPRARRTWATPRIIISEQISEGTQKSSAQSETVLNGTMAMSFGPS